MAIHLPLIEAGRLLAKLVKAKDEEEVKRLVYELISMNIDSENENILEISEVTWDLINRAPKGNIATPFVGDFEIYEER